MVTRLSLGNMYRHHIRRICAIVWQRHSGSGGGGPVRAEREHGDFAQRSSCVRRVTREPAPWDAIIAGAWSSTAPRYIWTGGPASAPDLHEIRGTLAVGHPPSLIGFTASG